jgi:mannose-6-phosphate isomerase-like protein (cupin superfamily)
VIVADLNRTEGRTFPARRRTQPIAGGLSSIQTRHFAMGLVTLEPQGGQVPWHNHDQEEVYLVLEGDGEMVLGEEIRILSAGQAVYIPSSVHHQLTNLGKAPLRMLFTYGPGGEVAHWRQELDNTLPRAGAGAPPLPKGACPQFQPRSGSVSDAESSEKGRS